MFRDRIVFQVQCQLTHAESERTCFVSRSLLPSCPEEIEPNECRNRDADGCVAIMIIMARWHPVEMEGEENPTDQFVTNFYLLLAFLLWLLLLFYYLKTVCSRLRSCVSTISRCCPPSSVCKVIYSDESTFARWWNLYSFVYSRSILTWFTTLKCFGFFLSSSSFFYPAIESLTLSFFTEFITSIYWFTRLFVHCFILLFSFLCRSIMLWMIVEIRYR